MGFYSSVVGVNYDSYGELVEYLKDLACVYKCENKIWLKGYNDIAVIKNNLCILNDGY